ncbi:MAG TPA: tetratricopeptide repeat protein [Bacillota bacterium]|nr:tetratricopeptide repeat protein [Bacillota bacterium]
MNNYELGEEQYEKEMYETAYDYFVKAYDEGLFVNDSLNYIGCCQMNLGLLEEAITTFDKLIEKSPDWERPYFNKGRVLMKQEKFEEALIYFNKAEELNPNNEDTLFYLGVYYMKVDELEKAKMYYEKSLQIDDAQAEVHLNLGIVYYRMDLNEKGIEEFERALKIDCELVDGYINKSIIETEMGKYRQAIGTLKNAYLLAPEDEEILKDIIAIYSKLNDKKRKSYWENKLNALSSE